MRNPMTRGMGGTRSGLSAKAEPDRHPSRAKTRTLARTMGEPEAVSRQKRNPIGIHRKQKPDGACGMVKPEAVSRQRSEPFSMAREAKRATRN